MLSAVFTVALVALARAAPAVERAVTVTEVTDVYTTVYDDAPSIAAVAPSTTAATSAASAARKWWWKGHRSSSSSAAAAEMTTVVVTPTESSAVVTSTPMNIAPAVSSTNAAAASSSAPAAASSSATAPVASSSTEAASLSVASVSSAPNSYAQIVIDHHNAHRANHSAQALQWDADVAATAFKIANSCNYAHDTTTDGGGYGQNIAAGCPADNISSIITELFYNGEQPNFNGLYGQKTPDGINDASKFDGWGHFTQLVWKSSTTVGCATVDCTGRGNGPKGLGSVGANVAPIFTVCNYKSPGNYLGEFANNVGRPLGHPTIHWDTQFQH